MADMALHTIDYLFIGGERVAPATDQTITIVSPWDEQPIAVVPEGSREDIDRAVAAAVAAQNSEVWGRAPLGVRIAAVGRLADVYEARKDDIAEAMSREMGCPRSQIMFMHVDPAVRALRYYAELMKTFPFVERREGLRATLVKRRPVGVAAAIVPWNGPAYLSIMKVAPALAAGCAVVLKPSPEAPLSSYVLADIATEAQLPAGALNIVPADRDVSEYLVLHPDVRKVSFTGSSAVGARIAQLCGQDLKRVSLELGGKSAAIFLEDADVPAAVRALRIGTFANAGQVCTARTRLIVPWSRYEEVVAQMAAMADSIVVGDPSDERTEMGPVVSARQRERVLGYVADGLAAGARQVTSRKADDLPQHGWFVAPTVFADVTNDMTIAREEIFGPVAAVMGYETVDEAVAIANDSDYGLSGSVFTTDVEAGIALAERIESGTFGVNTFGNDITAPFGGVKASGLGREMGPEGLGEYLEFQSVLLPQG
jgi:acyl-CoA reductase-like NAD-dependent aldehyde dehydrogenase